MTQSVQRWRRRAGGVAPPPRDVGEALAALSDDDLLRLRAIARLRARGLPGGVAWSDLLHCSATIWVKAGDNQDARFDRAAGCMIVAVDRCCNA